MAKAKTAYELLQQVCAHILEEPKRYHQGTWGLTRKHAVGVVGRENVPPCGTVACRAGWIVGLHDGLPSLKNRLSRNQGSVSDRANLILGFKENDDYVVAATSELFDSESVDPELKFTSPREYAKRGVAGLRAFMKKHKAHLQARKLRGV